MSRLGSLLLTSALALSLAACGGDSGESDTTTFNGHGVSITYPSGWKRQKQLEKDNGTMVFAVFSPSANGAVTRVTANVGPSTSVSAIQLGKGKGDERVAELSGRHVEDRRATVAGADGGAWRVVTDWTLTREDGQDVPARAIDIFARDDDQEYDLTISGPRASLRRPEIEKILRSFQLRD